MVVTHRFKENTGSHLPNTIGRSRGGEALSGGFPGGDYVRRTTPLEASVLGGVTALHTHFKDPFDGTAGRDNGAGGQPHSGLYLDPGFHCDVIRLGSILEWP